MYTSTFFFVFTVDTRHAVLLDANTILMIDPFQITKFDRTQEELEEFLLFCICVAGKNAVQQSKKLDAFLKQRLWLSPFQFINVLDKFLEVRLKDVKMGQYKRIQHAFSEVAKLKNLNTIGVNELENIKGIGPKTARFFLMHSRLNQQFAVLDTHILKFLKSKGIVVPKATPSKKKYLQLEKVFLDFVQQSGKTAAELDLEIWTTYAK